MTSELAAPDPRQQLTNVLADGFIAFQGATRAGRKRGEYQYLIDALLARRDDVLTALGGTLDGPVGYLPDGSVKRVHWSFEKDVI